MEVQVLAPAVWRPRAERHEARVEPWTGPHLERRQAGRPHPVEDFLFTYYGWSPSALRRWHPGFGVALEQAPEYDGRRGYGSIGPAAPGGIGVRPSYLLQRLDRVRSTRDLLAATAAREPSYRCFGLHEWAMVYHQPAGEIRHAAWPLRLGTAGTDTVVERHRVACSHFDAFRFFTADARPLNVLQPGPADRASFEQPACLHAGMDLYRHAMRLSPLVPSELVADCFGLAREIRVLDMRASPYDLAGLGLEPVRIETPEGKQEYAAAQRAFAERGAPLRQRLVDHCDRLLAAAAASAPTNG